MLFLLYINDMTLGLKSQVHQFADDTNLLLTYNDPIHAVSTLNHDLDLLSKWAAQWRVTFNPLKTKYMVLSLKNNIPPLNPIYFNNIPITQTPTLTSLGVTITQTLSWNEHVFKQIDKASKRLFILRKYKYLLPRVALERIYTSMIRPVLEFGDVIYDSISLSTGQAIESIQRQSAIICTGAYRHTRHLNLLSELGWDSMADRRRFHKLCLFYKIFHQIYPSYLYNHLHFPTPSTYNLRHQASVLPRHSRLSSSFHSFFPSCSREWNNLPHNIQHAVSFATFRSLVKPPQITNKKYTRLAPGNPGRWLSRLRMGLSALNHHRYQYHFIQSPTCPFCQTHSESTEHYFFQCPNHHIARTNLIFRLETELGLDTDNLVQLLETILFGKF